VDQNPYAPPTSDLGEVKPPSELEGRMTLAEAEALRRTHLTHEARLRSMGTLMLLGAFNLILGLLTVAYGVYGVVDHFIDPGIEAGAPQMGVIVGMFGLLITMMGALSVRGGMGLRRLDPQDHTFYATLVGLWLLTFLFLSFVGLLAVTLDFPLVALWALYLLLSLVGLRALVLLHSPEGTIVLSPEYQEARRLTPHIRFKTRVVTWIVLGLLVLGLPLAMFFSAGL